MALNTYTTVKQALPAILDVGTAQLAFTPSGDLDDIFTLAEQRIIDDVMSRGGVRAWESTLNGTITAAGTIDVPTGYLEVKHAYVNRSPVQWIERRSPEQVYREYPVRAAGGIPKIMAREGEQFIFGPYPDSQYLITGMVYTRPATVVGTTATFTGVFSNHSGLLIYAACSEAESALKRPQQVAQWEQKYAMVLDRVIGQEMRERWSGSNLAIRPG